MPRNRAAERAKAEAKKWMADVKKDIRQQIRAEKKALIDQTTQEQRRAFIKFLHEGKTIKEAGDLLGMSSNVAHEVFIRNLKVVKSYRLCQPEDVR